MPFRDLKTLDNKSKKTSKPSKERKTSKPKKATVKERISKTEVNEPVKLKRYKVNKLVEDKKEPLGAIKAAEEHHEEPKVEIKEIEEPVSLEAVEEKEKPVQKASAKEKKPASTEEEIPEYKVFVFDE